MPLLPWGSLAASTNISNIEGRTHVAFRTILVPSEGAVNLQLNSRENTNTVLTEGAGLHSLVVFPCQS